MRLPTTSGRTTRFVLAAPDGDAAPLSQDPSLHLWRRDEALSCRRPIRHGRCRGAPRQLVRLLRPALRRRVLATAPTTPTCTSCPPTGPRPGDLPWTALLQARAIENQAYVIGCNRVGMGNGIRLQRRLADHRSAGRGAGQRGAVREHPVRRHHRRACRRGARSIPVPAGPSVARHRSRRRAATIDDGLLAAAPGSSSPMARRDDTSVVVWLQTESIDGRRAHPQRIVATSTARAAIARLQQSTSCRRSRPAMAAAATPSARPS